MIVLRAATLATLLSVAACCDLEGFFAARQVSVEESTVYSAIIFRGLTLAAEDAGDVTNDVAGDVFNAYFELVNTYKGAMLLNAWGANNYSNMPGRKCVYLDYSTRSDGQKALFAFPKDRAKRINVTISAKHPVAECPEGSEVPREYIVFCDLENGQIRANSVALWDETADDRVWSVLGWSKWSDWSACSVSCSSGIQQRVRHCLKPLCPGFNIEQRHCNLFGCGETINPLEAADGKYFHPSKDGWMVTPDRPSAWRLHPGSYLWLPAHQLFSEEDKPFPAQFALFVTLRVHNGTMGTIFSLRSRRLQDNYLSLEVAGSDLKLIHAASNGTDVVRIPAQLTDGRWHQIAVSIRGDSVVDSFVDCEWARTDVLRAHTLDIPDDADLIIGYLFTGDLEQLSIVPDPRLVNLQCSVLRTPIIDLEDDASQTSEIVNGNDTV